jgi:SAM-dependent methyltransferase
VLDVGCGRAELLLRIIERFGCTGVGVDVNAVAVAAAKKAAARRTPPGALALRAEPFDPLAFAPDSFDLVACVGSCHAIADYETVLRTLPRLLRPGGSLLVGEGYWKRPPPPAYLDFLGCPADAYETHEGNVALAERAGLEVTRHREATDAEWTAYEDAYAANVERFLAAHPDDPDAAQFRSRIDAWRDAYLRWGRTTLGFGLYLLRCAGR